MSLTRQQQHLARALGHIQAFEQEKVDDATKKTYGGLCHTFPVWIRTNGLCQALAFVHEKKKEKRAYALLWTHVAATLGQEEGKLLDYVRTVGAPRYLFETRLLLDAWVYYKRFAVGILGVEQGEQEVTEG